MKLRYISALACLTVATFGFVACGTEGRARAAGPDSSPPSFEVGFGERDITPPAGLPMWGYGARHDMLSQGALDPLFAKAVVIRAGSDKLAIVGLDMGRGPTQPMMEKIRSSLREQAQIANVMISGSHTHHGPVIELTDRKGYGKGKFDAAVAYSNRLPELIVEAILEADRNAKPARIGINSRVDLNLNRNRQSKRIPKATDPMLAVIRFDDSNTGKPIAIVVNFAAHAVMTNERILKYSADYPGYLKKRVESQLATPCVFMQGAAGDMSINAGEFHGPERFGEHLADLVVELARATKTQYPPHPSIKGRVDHFQFHSRTDFANPLVTALYSQAFFPELVRNFVAEFRDGVPTELNSVLLNGDTALVGASGEFFSNHSKRLKERSYVPHTLFFGYCNGHSMYFPTIEAASEGGYGADAQVSPAEVGAGEQVMNRALVNIYTMLGKLRPSDDAPPAEHPRAVSSTSRP